MIGMLCDHKILIAKKQICPHIFDLIWEPFYASGLRDRTVAVMTLAKQKSCLTMSWTNYYSQVSFGWNSASLIMSHVDAEAECKQVVNVVSSVYMYRYNC